MRTRCPDLVACVCCIGSHFNVEGLADGVAARTALVGTEALPWPDFLGTEMWRNFRAGSPVSDDTLWAKGAGWALTAMWQQEPRWTVPQLQERLSQPVLVCAGDRDFAIPLQHTLQLYQVLPRPCLGVTPCEALHCGYTAALSGPT